MSDDELTPEEKEIEEKIKNEMKNRSSLFDDKCYITYYKTEEELNRERINREREEMFYRTDGLSMGFHPEDVININFKKK
jgi:hypothetical protein